MTLLDCSSYESAAIEAILRGWLSFAGTRPEYAKMKTTMLHLVELSCGMDFSQQYIDEMKALLATMDDSKPEVKKVKAWLNK